MNRERFLLPALATTFPVASDARRLERFHRRTLPACPICEEVGPELCPWHQDDEYERRYQAERAARELEPAERMVAA